MPISSFRPAPPGGLQEAVFPNLRKAIPAMATQTAMRQTGLWSVYPLCSKTGHPRRYKSVPMRRPSALLPLLIPAFACLSGAAMAQDVPAEAERDLWCGTAFELMVADEPAEASPAAEPYREGARHLVQRALPIYLESGISDAALASYREKLDVTVARVVNGGGWSDGDHSPSFEDCKALLGQ
jgi:hypothetical protein